MKIYEYQELMREIDQVGAGKVSFNEFVSLMTKNVHEDGNFEVEIREAFREFDKDGHGFINSKEFSEVLTKIGDTLTIGTFILML